MYYEIASVLALFECDLPPRVDKTRLCCLILQSLWTQCACKFDLVVCSCWLSIFCQDDEQGGQNATLDRMCLISYYARVMGGS